MPPKRPQLVPTSSFIVPRPSLAALKRGSSRNELMGVFFREANAPRGRDPVWRIIFAHIWIEHMRLLYYSTCEGSGQNRRSLGPIFAYFVFIFVVNKSKSKFIIYMLWLTNCSIPVLKTAFLGSEAATISTPLTIPDGLFWPRGHHLTAIASVYAIMHCNPIDGIRGSMRRGGP